MCLAFEPSILISLRQTHYTIFILNFEAVFQKGETIIKVNERKVHQQIVRH